ncbi:MAG: ABC transporter permease [Gemmataceae bacterium]
MTALRFVFVSALKDIRRLWRDPIGLAMCIIMPFAVTTLVSVVFGGESVTPRGLLLVVDHDDSTLSSFVRGAFGQGPLAKMITVELVPAEEGLARINHGDGSALLEIPNGFQDKLLHDEPCTLKLLTNPAQRILPGIIQESLSMLSDVEYYAQAFLGDQIRKSADHKPSDAEIAEFSIAGRRLGDKFSRYLDPLVIKLETKDVEATKAPVAVAAYFFPGMLFFGVILVGQTLSGDIWKEKSAFTLRRTLTTSSQRWAFLAGKILAAMAVYGAVALVALISGRWLVHQTIPSPVLAWAWIVLTGLAMYSILLAINMLAGGERGANVLVSLFVFLFALVGGGMFPFEMMPEWLANIGYFTPNGWAASEFKTILACTVDSSRIWLAAAGLLGVAFLGYVITLLRLRRFALA